MTKTSSYYTGFPEARTFPHANCSKIAVRIPIRIQDVYLQAKPLGQAARLTIVRVEGAKANCGLALHSTHARRLVASSSDQIMDISQLRSMCSGSPARGGQLCIVLNALTDGDAMMDRRKSPPGSRSAARYQVKQQQQRCRRRQRAQQQRAQRRIRQQAQQQRAQRRFRRGRTVSKLLLVSECLRVLLVCNVLLVHKFLLVSKLMARSLDLVYEWLVLGMAVGR